ncbi:MAG: metal-dependent transcriptional regulator [Methanospirillum sp.]|nr:metal-dependent transcriptional regulator [Methanospirillum sp.]
MVIVEREDVLLSLMRQAKLTGQGGRPKDIVCHTCLSEDRIKEILSDLVKTGEVTQQEDGTYHLSPSGIQAAETIMRRHHVLETFLQEMLGMDHEMAHAQACTMEHHTTDDTINRLRRFLRGKRECPAVCPVNPDYPGHQGYMGHHGRRCAFKSLADCSHGDKVRIDAIRGCGRGGRLADLGLIPGERVTVKRRMADTLLINVKDCDIAISPEIARSVLVEVEN